MAVSLNAVVGVVNSSAKYQNFPRICIGASVFKATHFSSPSGLLLLSRPIKEKNGRPHLLVANSDRLVTQNSDKGSEKAERSFFDDPSSASSKNEPGDQIPEDSNGSMASSDLKQDASSSEIKSPIKRTRLTAREKLKAARVLSRNSESKPQSKPQLGNKVLEVLRESEKGKKRSRLPEAPSNLLDDSKRGMPKKGLTWELPVGVDVALIIFSVVFISTVMFTTTYIVWKVGAIHFNEY